MPESLFSKVAGLHSAILLKRDSGKSEVTSRYTRENLLGSLLLKGFS